MLRLSTESVSQVKQPLDAVKHFFMFHKLATVSLLNASLHSCDEARPIFEHPGNSILHQLFGILAIGRSYLLKLRFNVGREMYFHALQGT